MAKRKRRSSKDNETDNIPETEASTGKPPSIDNDKNRTTEDQPKIMDFLAPKNIQKMNLLLNPAKKDDRKEKEEKAIKKYDDTFGEMNLQASYHSLFMIMWYSQLPCFDVKNITSTAAGETSIIKKCFWKEKEMDCPTIFRTMPTDRGMCCVFNMKKAEEIYEKSIYEELLQKMQNTDFNHRYISTQINIYLFYGCNLIY